MSTMDLSSYIYAFLIGLGSLWTAKEITEAFTIMSPWLSVLIWFLFFALGLWIFWVITWLRYKTTRNQ